MSRIIALPFAAFLAAGCAAKPAQPPSSFHVSKPNRAEVACGTALDAERQPLAGFHAPISEQPVQQPVRLAVESDVHRYLGHRRSAYVNRTAGRQLVFSNVSGVDAAGLQRAIDCHQRAMAVQDYDVPSMRDCPLAVQGVHAKVEKAGATLVVTLTAGDAGTTRELLDRLDRLGW